VLLLLLLDCLPHEHAVIRYWNVSFSNIGGPAVSSVFVTDVQLSVGLASLCDGTTATAPL
jgi:hypothetical protein